MAKRKHVLVVDDEPGILRFVRISLTKAGYDVTTTPSGEEAISLAQSSKPDIMIIDILMTPMDGFELLDKLRRFSQVPVIVFTASNYIANKAIKIGANGFIAKPFHPIELNKKIEEVLLLAKNEADKM